MTRCRSPPLCHPENRSRPCGTGQPPQRAGQAPPVNGAGLTLDLFADVPSKRVQVYCARAATEPPREMRRHPAPVRYTFLAAFCWQRRRDIIDGLVDLLVLIMHRIGVRAERKVVQELLRDLQRVDGKTTLLYKLAEAALEQPEGIVKDVLFPVVGEPTLNALVREYRPRPVYRRSVHTSRAARTAITTAVCCR